MSYQTQQPGYYQTPPPGQPYPPPQQPVRTIRINLNRALEGEEQWLIHVTTDVLRARARRTTARTQERQGMFGSLVSFYI
jgi:hypothetical protein